MTDFMPTASLETLAHRAVLLRELRRFFDDAGFVEVDTPLMSRDIVVDGWLDPFVVEFHPEASAWKQQGTCHYLQTSPEFAMKRLLASGATAIYQLGKVFRNGEFGRLHNPEFTMLEWYRVGEDLNAHQAFTERLVRSVFEKAGELSPRFKPSARDRFHHVASRVFDPRGFERLTYDDAFERYAGQRVLRADVPDLERLALLHRLAPPPGLDSSDRDGWLNWLLAELVEPHLGRDRPVFLTEYPATQAALARTREVHPDAPSVADRFELYVDSIELCNGYDELTQAAVLRSRIREQAALRARMGYRPLPTEGRLLEAMEAGIPAASGNALGVDRLVMLAVGAESLADVIAFPFDRA